MTIKVQETLFEIDETVSPRPGPEPGTIIVRIKNGPNWTGNTFENCDLQIPENLYKDISGRA